MARPTLLDMAKQRGDDGVVDLLDEAMIDAPELRYITGMPISGSSFKSLVRTKLPKVGFSNANNGVDPGKSEYKLQQFECFPITPRFEVHDVVAVEHPKGVAGALADESVAMTSAVLQHFARCFYYGLAYDPNGFPGLDELIPDRNVVDAGGTGDAAQTSVYLFRVSEQDLQFVYGHNGLIKLGDPREETLVGANGKPMNGWVQTMMAHLGLMTRTPRTMVKIKGVSLLHPLTDAHLGDAMTRFPAGRGPSGIWLNRIAMESLVQSRTTELLPRPAMPSDWNGTPFRLTEAIVTGEEGVIPSQDDEVDLSFKNSVVAE